MSHAELTLTDWLALGDEAAARTAAAIARSADAELVGVTPTVYAGRPGRVALLDRGGIRYALVPGDTVRLGRPEFTPTDRHRADYATASDQYDLPDTVEGFLAGATSPAREVTLPARLMAVRAVDADDLLTADDEDDEGHSMILAALARHGVRPPTPDEWEHACGAGATTLFRWGDDYPDGEPYGDVPLIQEPSYFGLVIADDPYRAEFTTEPTVFCGGDGGAALCGGYGEFLAWITLATAYRDRYLHEAVYEGGLEGETPVRPVLPLS